jgi:hypothetical protein
LIVLTGFEDGRSRSAAVAAFGFFGDFRFDGAGMAEPQSVHPGA